MDPYWEMTNGWFRPFAPDEASLSTEARELISGIRALKAPESIYLRGSVLESAAPFPAADLDLFIIHVDGRRRELRADLQWLTRRPLDIKWLQTEDLNTDYVFRALLAHRSVHVSGPAQPLEACRVDQEFCWKHWVTYCIAAMPPKLECDHRRALIYFKQLTRCVGVIMLLKEQRFTRDIAACISYAETLGSELYSTLSRLRVGVETRVDATIDIRLAKRELAGLFDRWSARSSLH